MKTCISYSYVLMFFAILCVGCHIFSFKYIQHCKHKYFVALIVSSFLIWCLSRVFIYYSSYQLDIVFLHLLLNTSVFVTLFLSVFILNQKYNMTKMLVGLVLALFGLYLVKSSTY